MKKTIYTDEPQYNPSMGERIGMIFAFTMLCLVLPIALYIISMGG